MTLHQDAPGPETDFMTASEVMAECIRESQTLVGSKVDSSLHVKIVSILSGILLKQADLRYLPMSPIVSLAGDVVVSVSSHCITLKVSSDWMETLDKLLLTRVCKACGCTIPGRPHPVAECYEFQTHQIMEA